MHIAPHVIPDLIRDPCVAFPTVVRHVEGSGKSAVTYGPYADARELVGGFFIETVGREEARVVSLRVHSQRMFKAAISRRKIDGFLKEIISTVCIPWAIH